jgi:hypothetical protein
MKAIDFPKRRFGESLRQYAERMECRIDEIPILQHDPVTRETKYAGFGWYSQDAEEIESPA